MSKLQMMEDSSWNYLAKALAFFFGFLYLFYLAKFLGPEDFGRIIFLMTVVPGFAILFGLGALQDMIVNFGAKYSDKKLLNRFLATAMGLSFLLSALLVIAAKFIPGLFADTELLLVLISIPLLPLYVLYAYYYSVFQAFRKFSFLAKIVLLDTVANFGLAALFLLVLNLGPASVIAARLIVYVIDIAVFVFGSSNLDYSKGKQEWKESEVAAYAKNAVAIEVPKQLPGQAINWLLGAFAPTKLLGEYYFAQKIVTGAIDNIYSAIKETVYAYTNENYKKSYIVKTMVAKSVRICTLSTAAVFVLLSIAIYPILQILFPEYINAWMIVIGLAAVSVINTVTITSTYFRTMNRLRESLEIAIYFCVFSLLASAPLVAMFQVTGLIAAKALTGVFQIFLYKKYLKKNNFDFSIIPNAEDVSDLYKFFVFVLKKGISKLPGKTQI